jgi:hypothetical protein
MPVHQTPAQRKTVERVMHEFKHGELKTARGKRNVKNPKQAIAIALSEAGASQYDTPKERAHNLRRTKAKERRGETGQAMAEGRRRTAGRRTARHSAPLEESCRDKANSVKRVQNRLIHSRTLADFALPLFSRVTINTLLAVRILNVSCSDTTRASPSCATQFDTARKRYVD